MKLNKSALKLLRKERKDADDELRRGSHVVNGYYIVYGFAMWHVMREDRRGLLVATSIPSGVLFSTVKQRVLESQSCTTEAQKS